MTQSPDLYHMKDWSMLILQNDYFTNLNSHSTNIHARDGSPDHHSNHGNRWETIPILIVTNKHNVAVCSYGWHYKHFVTRGYWYNYWPTQDWSTRWQYKLFAYHNTTHVISLFRQTFVGVIKLILTWPIPIVSEWSRDY